MANFVNKQRSERDRAHYFLVTDVESFKDYVSDKFFTDAIWEDTFLDHRIKLVTFKHQKTNAAVREHWKTKKPKGVCLEDRNVLLFTQLASASANLESTENQEEEEVTDCKEADQEERKEPTKGFVECFEATEEPNKIKRRKYEPIQFVSEKKTPESEDQLSPGKRLKKTSPNETLTLEDLLTSCKKKVSKLANEQIQFRKEEEARKEEDLLKTCKKTVSKLSNEQIQLRKEEEARKEEELKKKASEREVIIIKLDFSLSNK